jgi:hypothetical protein
MSQEEAVALRRLHSGQVIDPDMRRHLIVRGWVKKLPGGDALTPKAKELLKKGRL